MQNDTEINKIHKKMDVKYDQTFYEIPNIPNKYKNLEDNTEISSIDVFEKLKYPTNFDK